MLIAFIILWIILAKFGWPMFEGMLEKRENTIKEALEKSEAAPLESERVLQEYKKQLDDAKAQSAQIVADAKPTGEAVKADITAKAQAEAADMIDEGAAPPSRRRRRPPSPSSRAPWPTCPFRGRAPDRRGSHRGRAPCHHRALRERGGQFQCQLIASSSKRSRRVRIGAVRCR